MIFKELSEQSSKHFGIKLNFDYSYIDFKNSKAF